MAESKIILITGATRGIGWATAKLLHDRGALVILASRDLERSAAAKQMAAESLQLDVTDPVSVQTAAAVVGKRWGRLDGLINNGAVLLDHYASLAELEPETLRETFETNVIGILRVCQAFLPLLRASDDPRIVNVSSGAGQLDGEPQAWAPAYSISKTALNMLTQQLTAAEPRIATNSVCPGWCRTDMGGAEAPLCPEEGADSIVWLALEAPATLRGQFIKQRVVIPW